mmetsp:Transcript_15071/g.25596  ORF Transcript_15071/g.25596 Transcript_15071/m.25596 type:complete len:81 (-) Transcript_15071:940-1182(-)
MVWTGVGGSSDRAYIKYLVDFLVKSNEDHPNEEYICGVIHPRGSGVTELTSTTMYDFRRMSDQDSTLSFIHEKLKNSKVI